MGMSNLTRCTKGLWCWRENFFPHIIDGIRWSNILTSDATHETYFSSHHLHTIVAYGSGRSRTRLYLRAHARWEDESGVLSYLWWLSCRKQSRDTIVCVSSGGACRCIGDRTTCHVSTSFLSLSDSFCVTCSTHLLLRLKRSFSHWFLNSSIWSPAMGDRWSSPVPVIRSRRGTMGNNTVESVKKIETSDQQTDQQYRHLCEEQVQSHSNSGCCSYELANRELRRVICESIQEIEATRKSFKSKRLEALRKRLIEVLAHVQ